MPETQEIKNIIFIENLQTKLSISRQAQRIIKKYNPHSI